VESISQDQPHAEGLPENPKILSLNQLPASNTTSISKTLFVQQGPSCPLLLDTRWVKLLTSSQDNQQPIFLGEANDH
jgi:hypothetical protein